MFLLGLWCSVEGVGCWDAFDVYAGADGVDGEFKALLTVGWVDAWDQEGFGDLLQAHTAALLALGLGGDAEDFPRRCLQPLDFFGADLVVLGEVVAGGFRAAEGEVSFRDVVSEVEDLG